MEGALIDLFSRFLTLGSVLGFIAGIMFVFVMTGIIDMIVAVLHDTKPWQ